MGSGAQWGQDPEAGLGFASTPQWELGEAQTPVTASDGAVGLCLLPSCCEGDILSGSIS